MSKKSKVKKIKIKTCRGAAKRFKITGSGKVRFRRANRNHIKTKQTTQQVRHCRPNGVLAPCDGKMVHAMLPYEG